MSRFWFMNHFVNPFTKMLLRSPLHRFAGDSILLLTYRGKKSGKEYTLPVEYAQIGQTIFIVPGMPEHKTWWRNLCGGTPVQVRLQGRVLAARAETLTGDTSSSDLVNGLNAYFQKFPAAAKINGVARVEGGFNQDEILSAARKMTIVKASLDG